ncbi:hypothetical protein [Candidatus Accumulibacter sp. ACC003]|uniref:hypothetical protein n=1 Tax=Candidatus Accumulibacter sp. ACC003 TaxID=2823334 RepID=UPI0025BCD15A|nr:hypothetical protein [Candidatus Accumulibacter sp. ACC003]
MNKSIIMLTLGVSLAVASVATAIAAPPAAAAGNTLSPTAATSVDFKVLKGAWVRPDGGYTITISDVAAGGQIDALYFNPGQLPFARAEASRADGKLRAFFELTAGGYGGSTYDLTYDPANDRLIGIYYQAVAKQKYDIYFQRRR